MFQFNRVGEIELEKNDENTQLQLIDLGVIDFDDNLVWVEPNSLNQMVTKINDMKIKVVRSELIYKVKMPVFLKNEDELVRLLDFIEELENNDDVLGVFAGFDYN